MAHNDDVDSIHFLGQGLCRFVMPVVEQNIARFLSAKTALKEIIFEADPRVRFGGCFIETPGGDIDARLESQFEVITEVIQTGEDEN